MQFTPFTTIIYPYDFRFNGKELIVKNLDSNETLMDIKSNELLDPVDTMKELEKRLHIDLAPLGYLFCEFYQTVTKA